VSSYGEVTLYLVMYLPKEFKTFVVKISPRVLQSIETADFDFSSLDYIDFTKKIRKDMSR
jgi:hypothetical protein